LAEQDNITLVIKTTCNRLPQIHPLLWKLHLRIKQARNSLCPYHGLESNRNRKHQLKVKLNLTTSYKHSRRGQPKNEGAKPFNTCMCTNTELNATNRAEFSKVLQTLQLTTLFEVMSVFGNKAQPFLPV
jgi:hypothetical protein